MNTYRKEYTVNWRYEEQFNEKVDVVREMAVDIVSKMERGDLLELFDMRITKERDVYNPNKFNKTYHMQLNSDMNAIDFGNWLLKHCTPVFDDGVLTWVMGGYMKSTRELFELYKKGYR